MFDNLRRKSTPSIKYNDTADYKYMEITGVQGAFTKQPIDPATLPEGFHAFSLVGKSGFSRIVPAGNSRSDGTFICKDEKTSHLGHGRGRLSPEDCVFLEDKSFDFLDFFGQKYSLECMIRMAEEKKLLAKESPEKAQEERQDPSF